MNHKCNLIKTAGEVRVGDIVKFDVEGTVRVDEIEDNSAKPGEALYSEYLEKNYGKSLLFSCSMIDGDVPCLYVRRELSPLSGTGVVR